MIYLKYIITSIGLMGYLYGNLSPPLDGYGQIGGIHFFTMYDGKPQTSLIIPSESTLSFDDGFSLEFDFQIREKNPFGYILSISSRGIDDLLVLSYIDFRNPDTSYIELSIQNDSTHLTIPFPNELIGRKKWHQFEMRFEKGFIQLSLNDLFTDSAHFSPIQFKDYVLNFGKIKIKTEPPRMGLREIRIIKQGQDIGYWPLDEKIGSEVHDRIESKHGEIIDGELLVGRHTFLHPVHSIINEKNPNMGILINQDDMFYYYFTPDSIYKLNIQTWVLSPGSTIIPIPAKHTLLYNETENQLLLFHKGGDLPVYSFDWETGNWPNLELSLESKGQYYDAKRIYNSKTEDIYFFGGYGNYIFKNDIFKYSLSDERWSKVQPKLRNNDIFEPRGPKHIYDYKDKIYIFGGLGSKSGKQETGTQLYSDIWSFDWKTDSLLLVSPNEALPSTDVSLGVVIWEKSNQAIEFFQKELDSTFTYYLNIFDFPYGEKKEFPLNFEDYFVFLNALDIQMDLIEKTSELLFIVRGSKNNTPENNGIHFFTLALPLINPEEKIEAKDNKMSSVIIPVALVIGGLWFYFIKRHKNSSMQNEVAFGNQNFDILDKGVTVQIFGVFRMWIDGQEIFKKDWHSKKARELFIYLILKNHQGVTGEEISLAFWPDVTADSGKNSRGTSLSKIRKLLGEYKTHLVTKDGRYIILNGDTFLTDYSIVQNWVQNNTENSSNDVNYKLFLILFGENGVLPEIHEEWVDGIKTDFNQRFIKRLKKECIHRKEFADWEQIEEMGAFMLKWNPLDDEALSIYIHSLIKNSKPSIAHQIYSDFIKRYEKELGEPYMIEFNDIVS